MVGTQGMSDEAFVQPDAPYRLSNMSGRTKQSEPKVSEMNLIQSYSNWRRNRETLRELNRLSSRELNDLGISRSDITFGARKPR